MGFTPSRVAQKSKYWTHNVDKWGLTMNKLKKDGLKFNIETFFFGQTEMEYLYFWATRDGVNPINKKCKEWTI